ncbi:MAG: hypothetical protein DIU70_007535 [Bacillota bacterium]|nr:MAG: hypothetical protein DIU70_03790 [Bacillota bacterium]
MFEVQGKRVWIRRDGTADDGFEGVVERVSGKWIYVRVDDPTGQTLGIWVNTDLQREIAILAD